MMGVVSAAMREREVSDPMNAPAPTHGVAPTEYPEANALIALLYRENATTVDGDIVDAVLAKLTMSELRMLASASYKLGNRANRRCNRVQGF
jgi:hypothetical protein